MRPVLRLQNISQKYRSAAREVTALAGVNLELFPDNSLALVGESGCGKTTLGELTVGLRRPHQGQIIHDSGIDIANCKSATLQSLRPKLQMIFQNPFAAFSPHLTLGQSLVPVASRYAAPGQSATETLFESLINVGLNPDQLNRKPNQLSGGQLQRASIARVLLCRPQYIVADEISSALDVATQDELTQLLAQLRQQQHFSLLFITHDLGLAKRLTNDVCIMSEGRIVEYGKTDQVLNNPVSITAQRLVAAIPHFNY